VPPHPGWRAVGKTGRSIWVSTSASRIEWQGRPAIVAFYLDVSERRRAEDALRESEAFLRLSQRVGKIGSWQWDLQTNHVRWSEVMYDLYGTVPEDFDGTLQGAIRHTHPDDLPAVQASIERIIRTDEAGPIEYRVIKPDGQIANLWGHGEILRDQTGRPVQVIGTVTDITERKQAEGALRESEARFRQLFEHSPDAIFVEDFLGNVLDVNPAACRLHGVDRGT
jgi:PAS domain S-box-containing protein